MCKGHVVFTVQQEPCESCVNLHMTITMNLSRHSALAQDHSLTLTVSVQEHLKLQS